MCKMSLVILLSYASLCRHEACSFHGQDGVNLQESGCDILYKYVKISLNWYKLFNFLVVLSVEERREPKLKQDNNKSEENVTTSAK